MELTSENVHDIFLNCLFEDDEPHDQYVKAEGVMINVGFHPERLESHRGDIESMLDYLHANFSVGGGWSFLNACNRADGTQWTGLHSVVDELVCLGLAIKHVSYVAPREMWPILPGGMPYFVVRKRQ
jgi:hypothetical protein